MKYTYEILGLSQRQAEFGAIVCSFIVGIIVGLVISANLTHPTSITQRKSKQINQC